MPGKRVAIGQPVTVEIPADVLSQLETLAGRGHHLTYEFEPWQDEVLRRYWPRSERSAPRKEIVRLLARDGHAPSEGTVRRRVQELGIKN